MILKNHKVLTSKLVELSDEMSPQTHLVSLYFNLENRDRRDIDTLLKSFIKKGFKDNKELQYEKSLRDKIISDITEETRSLEIGSNLAIFVKLITKENDIKTFITQLDMIPENDVFIDKVFNLDQLVWESNLTARSIILNVNSTKCEIYKYELDKIDKIKVVKNKIMDTSEKEYVETYSPRPTKESRQFHGTEDKKISKQQKESFRKFFSQILDKLEKDLTAEIKYENIVIFHSAIFNHFSDEIRNNVETKLAMVPIIKPIVVEDEKKLVSQAKKVIKKFKKHKTQELLTQARESFKLYAKGWREVANASRSGQIDDLFLNYKAKKAGYIADNNLIYTDAVKHANEVNNISPWLITDTLRKSGSVHVLKDNKMKNQVSAKLRYKR